MDNESTLQLASIAMEGVMTHQINYTELGISKEDIFYKMAESVIKQLEQVPEDQRAIVAMATMTKLLVENFSLTAKIQGS